MEGKGQIWILGFGAFSTRHLPTGVFMQNRLQ
jgi:hypothetical protein